MKQTIFLFAFLAANAAMATSQISLYQNANKNIAVLRKDKDVNLYFCDRGISSSESSEQYFKNACRESQTVLQKNYIYNEQAQAVKVSFALQSTVSLLSGVISVSQMWEIFIEPKDQDVVLVSGTVISQKHNSTTEIASTRDAYFLASELGK